MKALAILKRTWYSLGGYIPVLMMLLFAMLTYWLLQVTPRFTQSQNKRPLEHVEDYFMRGFEVTTYESNGEVRAHILGTYARHYADTDSIEIDSPFIYAQTKIKNSGFQKSQSTAKLGISNSDASQIELKGNVQFKKYDLAEKSVNPVVTKMLTEELKIDSDRERVSSNLPVRIEKSNQKMYADSMDYDNVQRHLSLRGNVRVTFEAK